MTRLYRRGIIQNWGSSWFPTIREAMNYQEKSGQGRNTEEEDAIGIMWLTEKSFNKYFETRGIGYRAKSEEAFLAASMKIQYLSIEKLEELLENPIIAKLYGDAETIQKLDSL